jgi:hypothetical protein
LGRGLPRARKRKTREKRGKQIGKQYKCKNLVKYLTIFFVAYIPPTKDDGKRFSGAEVPRQKETNPLEEEHCDGENK